jgi:hypothetical protein
MLKVFSENRENFPPDIFFQFFNLVTCKHLVLGFPINKITDVGGACWPQITTNNFVPQYFLKAFMDAHAV